ncbi:hypothetical protein [Massilia sp. TWR1-2-2]|uniref:hypothetical protein n=1 Tax=Massilia sp. TWR1-2-2 TaxID=2804584 RepID=UPI003CEB9E43
MATLLSGISGDFNITAAERAHKPFSHKKKPAEASSVPMYYQCFNRVSGAHAICVVR